jgi:hypothetical protein
MARRHETTIASMAEVPRMESSLALKAAVGDLTLRNTVYLIPGRFVTQYGPITKPESQADFIASTLGTMPDQLPWRVYRGGAALMGTAPGGIADIGMRASVDINEWPIVNSLRFHHTSFIEEGTEMRAVFANGTQAYKKTRNKTAVNAGLTHLLAEGKTDTRYVDPDSFQEVRVTQGESLLFHPYDSAGIPFLHSFQTEGSGNRRAEVTPIVSIDGPGIATGLVLGQLHPGDLVF